MQSFLPNDSRLDIGRLSQVFSNTVATYKFYWFISLINLLNNEERRKFSFWEIIAGMVAEAWYPIHFFKLSFGKADSLYEKSIRIQQLLNIPIDCKKELICKSILDNINKPEIKRCLSVFSLNVPYWFLSPWIKASRQTDVEEMSNHYYGFCPYAIQGQDIWVSEPWADYIRVNSAVLLDFCFWNLTSFLQKRNPNVPDLPSKLVKPISRNSLAHQHKYWNHYLEEKGPIHCIYTGKLLYPKDYDLDHFIPWSFVSHDLIWNLIPADPSINSSKGDNLPPLDKYLAPMANLQHSALSLCFANNQNDRMLEDYLVFRRPLIDLVEMDGPEFISLFQNYFTPMFQTASNMGFASWK